MLFHYKMDFLFPSSSLFILISLCVPFTDDASENDRKIFFSHYYIANNFCSCVKWTIIGKMMKISLSRTSLRADKARVKVETNSMTKEINEKLSFEKRFSLFSVWKVTLEGKFSSSPQQHHKSFLPLIQSRFCFSHRNHLKAKDIIRDEINWWMGCLLRVHWEKREQNF